MNAHKTLPTTNFNPPKKICINGFHWKIYCSTVYNKDATEALKLKSGPPSVLTVRGTIIPIEALSVSNISEGSHLKLIIKIHNKPIKCLIDTGADMKKIKTTIGPL